MDEWFDVDSVCFEKIPKRVVIKDQNNNNNNNNNNNAKIPF